jgi:hypothetical protein
MLSSEGVWVVQCLLRAYVAAAGARGGLGPGAGLSPSMRELRDALAVATADIGRADVRQLSDSRPSDQQSRSTDLVDVKEAMRVLDLSARQVRRLATESGEFGRVDRAGRSILIRRDELQACAERRRKRN